MVAMAIAVSGIHAQEIPDNNIQKSQSAGSAQLLDANALEKDPSSLSEAVDADFSSRQKTADEGIHIEVEQVANASGKKSESGYIRIYSPWPAKPMSKAPDGWKYVPAPAQLQAYNQKIKLGDGTSVDLSITPFVLVPVSDGATIIRIAEPGYHPALDLSQEKTIGSMLQKSTSEIEDNEKQAAKAISLLQQLLSSLPQKQQ